jgi:serine/threonine protein kinase
MSSGHDETVADSHDGHADEAYCSACNTSFPPDTDKCPNDGSKLVRLKAQKDEMLGRVLEQRYEVRLPLGKGGMGTVYRALQIAVDREVAVKVVHAKLASDRQAVKRFLREARLASRLSQPNIVNVYDFGQTEDGVLYLVMELLRGRTLATELGGQRRFSVKRTATIALQLCDALEAAHAQGIVHRDLKPGNIVILDDPPGRDLLKVLDFGLAKSLITDTTSQVTNTNAILGTPLYMSPEQVEGKQSDQRSDLYSLGCILYELLAGTPPFVDTSVNLLLAKHLAEVPAPLPPHIPTAMRKTVEQMLAKRPEDRIQTAGEVRAAIQAVVDGVAAARDMDSFDTTPDVRISSLLPADPALAHTQTPLPGQVGPLAAMTTPVPLGESAAAPRPSLPLDVPVHRPRWPYLVALVGLAGGIALAVKLAGRGGGAPVAAATPDARPAALDAATAAAPPVLPDAAPAPVTDAATAIVTPIDGKSRDRDRDRDRRKKDAATGTAQPPPIVIDAPPPAPKIDAPPPRKIDAAEPDVNFYPNRPKKTP